jgi:hypothetical protein
MTEVTLSPHGKDLLDLLPEVYRKRDRESDTAHGGHLQKYLSSHGILLDRLRQTLLQMHADHFPDVPENGLVCQAWVIPYLATLVGAELVSPFANGQRVEVSNAIRWAKAKGTLKATAEIAEAITQTESELQEGFQRIIRSALPGEPILPANAYGVNDHPLDDILSSPTQPFSTVNPQIAARHPGLPAATIDLRIASRAVRATPGSSGSRISRFGYGTSLWPADENGKALAKPPTTSWRQRNPNGAPCFPDSYEDVSRRTVDMRDSDAAARQGRYHPKRLLIYLPPPAGFFPPVSTSITLPNNWMTTTTLDGRLNREILSDGTIQLQNNSSEFIVITNAISITAGAKVAFKRLVFSNTVMLTRGSVTFTRCAVSQFAFGVSSNDRRLNATSTLFGSVTGGIGFAQLEYVTILDVWSANAKINASEVIFPDVFDGKRIECARYSSLPAIALADVANHKACTTSGPLYRSSIFGQAGAGVLAQDTDLALLKGAEDGGEIGAYHDWRYAAQRDALILKLTDFLPMGMTPVVIWDERLLFTPLPPFTP